MLKGPLWRVSRCTRIRWSSHISLEYWVPIMANKNLTCLYQRWTNKCFPYSWHYVTMTLMPDTFPTNMLSRSLTAVLLETVNDIGSGSRARIPTVSWSRVLALPGSTGLTSISARQAAFGPLGPVRPSTVHGCQQDMYSWIHMNMYSWIHWSLRTIFNM